MKKPCFALVVTSYVCPAVNRIAKKKRQETLRGYLPFFRGGEGEIRTPETFSRLLAFQASALGHYATSPLGGRVYLSARRKSLLGGADLAGAHAALHFLSPGHDGDGESNDAERAGCGAELDAERVRVDDVRLEDADERRYGDKEEKEADRPLDDAARECACLLLLAEKGHTEWWK